ncbi:hypothetical protein Patl1_28518 [Pistacia atlantica]|uniref:Uncharacterized protein n=1 Tax=Pistacia atlantica TaxID=434234 RepID=A0ACC1BEP6_9ROSI|nr:hypothetical protein Patl1_28518 [Pistacia atlantica]
MDIAAVQGVRARPSIGGPWPGDLEAGQGNGGVNGVGDQ